jgi:hypothetical protein
MKISDPYSPTRERHGPASRERWGKRRQNDPPEGLKPRRTQGCRGLLGLLIEASHDRLDGPDHKRKADEHKRYHHAERRVSDLEAEFGERRAEQTVRRIERRQRNAGDRRRQRKRQINQRVENIAAGNTYSRAPTPR